MDRTTIEILWLLVFIADTLTETAPRRTADALREALTRVKEKLNNAAPSLSPDVIGGPGLVRQLLEEG